MASSELPLWEALAEQEVLFANQKGGGGLVIYMYIYIYNIHGAQRAECSILLWRGEF